MLEVLKPILVFSFDQAEQFYLRDKQSGYDIIRGGEEVAKR